jgi:predicted negative regulator of RcsB-dependent stress response
MKKNILILLVLLVIALVVVVSWNKKVQEGKMQNATVIDSFGTTSRQDTTDQIEKNINDIQIKTNSTNDFGTIDSGIKEI